MNKEKVFAISVSALFLLSVLLWTVWAANGPAEVSWGYFFPVGLLGCFAGICIIYAFSKTMSQRKKSMLSTLVVSLWFLVYFIIYAFTPSAGCVIGSFMSIISGIVCFIAIWAFYGLIRWLIK
jgi:hypothetical protein